jgi:hypothetical protein
MGVCVDHGCDLSGAGVVESVNAIASIYDDIGAECLTRP